MPAPSQTNAHNWTDRLAALIQLDLNGLNSELTAAAAQGLARQVDGSGDLLLEAALMPSALNVDRMSLPERYYNALPAILGRTALRDFASAISNFVATEDGGGYANFRAFLADKSAVIHPLAAELFRSVLGPTHFNNSDGDITTVFAPTYACRAPDRVYQGADGSLSEETIDAEDVGTADITLFASDDDALYIGSRFKFSQIIIGLSTLANVTIAPTFEIWNGNAWETLTVTDNSVGLTKNDTIKFTPPTNWARSNQDKGSSNLADLTGLYYVRISRTANTLGTPPVGTMIRIVPSAVLTGPSASTHLGVPQPPLAIARVTGTNLITIEAIAALDHTRFREGLPKLRALTPIAGTLTLTFSYVDELGVDSSQAQSGWSSMDAGDTFDLVLAGADTGVRSVKTNGTATCTAVEGVFEVFQPELRTPAL